MQRAGKAGKITQEGNMDAELDDMFPVQVGVIPFASDNAYGDVTPGSIVYHPAAIKGTNKLVRTAGGEQVVSTAEIYFGEFFTLHPGDRIVLPAGYSINNADVPILAIEPYNDPLTGNFAVVVYV